LRPKGQGHWEQKFKKKIVFRAYIRQKWTNLRQTKTKMIISPFYTYHWIHFTGKNASFCDNL